MGKKRVQITLRCREGGEGEENVCPLGRLSIGENINATVATFREFPGPPSLRPSAYFIAGSLKEPHYHVIFYISYMLIFRFS